MFKLGLRPIIWCSWKQSNVAFSSTKVEYCAITEGAKEATWLQTFLQTFLQEIGAIKECFTILHVDNQSYMKIAKDLVFHAGTNHIEAHYHFIREKVIS